MFHVSSDLNQTLGRCAGNVKYGKLQPNAKTTVELKVALQTIWKELPQEHVNKTVANFMC